MYNIRNVVILVIKINEQINTRISDSYSLLAIIQKLASQWHPTKNGSLTPNDVNAVFKQKIWWICQKGHEWSQHL